MSGTLTDQVALITGGGTGFGAAIARALAAEGARCVLAGRRSGPLEAVRDSLGPATLLAPCDVRDEAQVHALLMRVEREVGRLDVLVNSAGIFQMTSFEETTPEFWDETLNANLRSVFLMCRAAWPLLKHSHGQIVNISSVAGVEGYEGNAAYCASKFGLNGLTEVLAIEGRPHGIRALAVCPAAADTPLWEPGAPADVRARMMKAEVVAELVRWLVTAPRTVHVEPVVVRNFSDPWRA
jgi:NAD(P)-dependent dehydrogenase (short-subunit alcohol dehydrogenase family)